MKLHRQATIAPEAYAAAVDALYARLPAAAQGALYAYTESGSRALNEKLRRGEPLTAVEQNICELLDEVLATSHTSRRLVYRGVWQLDGALSPGDVFTSRQYLSTTFDPQQVFKFTDKTLPIVMEMSVVSGREVSYLRDEFEHLLPRNLRFVVRAVHEDVAWHAEYGTTGYTRSLERATVVELEELV